MDRQLYNKTIEVNGVSIFYREAGDSENQTILLLHGFPTSSLMLKNLMIGLADRFLLHLLFGANMTSTLTWQKHLATKEIRLKLKRIF